MKIAVLGCGATGSVYAALFASAGHEVWAIDRDARHIDAIRAAGLRVEGASGARTARIHATTMAADAGPCDLVILATKAMDVAAAARTAAALLRPDTPVISIQNGLGGPQDAEAVIGGGHVLVGVIGGFGASVRAPGHVHHNGWEFVRLGELAGGISPRVERLAGLWREAGFRVRVYADLDQLIWEKLVCNVAFSASCALTGLTIGGVRTDPDAWTVARDCAIEAYAVGHAKGVRFGFDDPAGYVDHFASRIPEARPSMLLDLLAHRRSEIDVINGAIPREGAKLGMTAPVNAAVTALVRARERLLGCR